MNQFNDPKLRQLFGGVVRAAKKLIWHESEPRMHHNARAAYPERWWEAEEEESGRITLPGDFVFHLQIRHERRGKEDRGWVLIFGRRIKGLEYETPNTQRATFNSDHRDEAVFWIRPTLDDAEKLAMQRKLGGSEMPRWDGRHIRLGNASPEGLLRRYLIALAAVEGVKGGWPETPFPFAREADEQKPHFEAADLSSLAAIQEGYEKQVSGIRRARCLDLLRKARDSFRCKKDGKLHCRVCDWYTRFPTRTEIVQIHHLRQLRDYPKAGRRLTLAEAFANLAACRT